MTENYYIYYIKIISRKKKTVSTKKSFLSCFLYTISRVHKSAICRVCDLVDLNFIHKIGHFDYYRLCKMFKNGHFFTLLKLVSFY